MLKNVAGVGAQQAILLQTSATFALNFQIKFRMNFAVMGSPLTDSRSARIPPQRKKSSQSASFGWLIIAFNGKSIF